jgi:hypothetical protein
MPPAYLYLLSLDWDVPKMNSYEQSARDMGALFLRCDYGTVWFALPAD